MARSFIQTGAILALVAPYAVSAGGGALVGSIFGVAQTDLSNGETGDFMLEGVHLLDKTDSQAWTVGARIYWDDTNKVCTTAAGGGANKLIGVAVEAVAGTAGLDTGKVRLSAAFTL